tara:strand:+ start:30014 stop:31333 length:1320 start_codon:yes stop_codon:yes gene_type:complete
MEDQLNNTQDQNQFHLDSERVTQLLEQTPSWTLRSGSALLLGIVLFFFLGAALFSYNDIISSNVVITTTNPPVYIKAKSSGLLTDVLVSTDQNVVKDQLIAIIQNSANTEHMILLQEQLHKLPLPPISLDSLTKLFPHDLVLGNVQNAYADFLNKYQNYILFQELNPDLQSKISLSKQLKDQLSLLLTQQKQLSLLAEDLKLSESTYNRDKKLLEKGVISNDAFQKTSRSFLMDKSNYQDIKTQISNTHIQVSYYENLLNQSDIKGKTNTNNYNTELNKAIQNLKFELANWMQQFALKSPIDGKISLFDVWSKYQNVSIDETVFTVIPENYGNIIGMIKLPIKNSSKVKVGQKVIVKLDNYRFEEYGSLEGVVTSISEVPKKGDKGMYSVQISINNLNTTFDKKLVFKQDMQGTADIIVEELSLLERLFYGFRKSFYRS